MENVLLFTLLVNDGLVVKRTWTIRTSFNFNFNDEKFENILDCIYSSLYTKNGRFEHKITVRFEFYTYNTVSEYEFFVRVNRYKINIKDIIPEIYKILMNKELE